MFDDVFCVDKGRSCCVCLMMRVVSCVERNAGREVMCMFADACCVDKGRKAMG